MSWASFFAGKSPAGWWRLGESSGATTAVDASGNGRDGTYKSGSITFSVTGSVAHDADTAITVAALTQGTGAYGALIADASWMNATSAVTFVISAKTTQAAIFLLTRWDAGTVANQMAALDLSGNKCRFYGNVAGTTVIATGATSVNDNVWHRLVGVFDGATLKVYVDGQLDGTATPAGAGPFTLNIPTVGRGLMIGGRYATTGNSQNAKTVDEAAFLTSAWTAADVLADYQEWSAKYAGAASPPALAIAASSTGVRGKLATASRGVTISAASAVRLGISGQASAALAIGTTSAGVRGKIAAATPSLSVAAVSAGIVVSGASGTAAPVITFSTTAAAALGRAGQAAPSLAIAASSTGVRGKLATATKTLVIAASAAAALGIAGTALPTLTLDVAAAGTVSSIPVGGASTTLSITAVSDGVVVSPPRTQIDWQGGRRRDGIGTATWDPPVIVIPQPATSVTMAKATAIDDVAMTGARAVLTSRTLAIPRARPRIVVAGGDRSLIRGIVTPEPTTGLIEPLLYGSGSIRWPQFHGAFERPGHGDWSWLYKYAPVKVQYVDDNDHVVDTDFRGFISDFGTSGRELTTSIMGEATGRGGRTWRPKPFVRAIQDIGHLGIMALRHGLRLPTMDKPPVTGIEVPDSGSQWQLDFLTSLTGRSTTLGGAQWTIMPDAHGRYRMFRKDVETIDFTVYVDDSRVRADLRRDFVEEHDREFVTAIGAHGMLIEFGRYPGLSSKGDPEPFPGHLELGDTGPDVFTLSWRLFQLGYLDDTNGDGKVPTPDVFTAKLAKAVRKVQDFAGLDETGEVDAATWRVAFKNDGQWSLRGSGIHPAAQKPFTRAFLHNASGQIIGRNPRSDRSRPFSDRAVNMGHVRDRSQARDWAQEDLSDDNAPNLVGTIDITMGAVISGEHHPEDPLTTDMLREARTIKPGMNGLVHYQGREVLMHVASRDLQDNHTVQIAVDTRGRDALEVWEIHELRHESHVNPERQWRRQTRSSVLDRDSMTGWSEIGGLIDSRVDWPGMTWTVFPVVAGEEGQIRDVDFQTVDDPAEFVLAFFGARISPERLAHLVENPLTAAGRRAWRRHGDELRDSHLWLYEAGWDDNPLGYHPTTKADAKLDFPEKGDDQVTGRWRDPAGFPYFCENGTVIWVAAFPRWDTHLDPGRLFKVQRDDSV